MAHLVIFTNNFPFGNGETFLETEIFYLEKHFKDIHIFPLFYGQSKKPRRIPENATYSEPFFNINVVNDRFRLLLNGTANVSPVMFAFEEMWRKKVFLSFSRFKNWLSELCIIRSLLAKTNRKKIHSKIQEHTILYFYWGDKSSGIVPFIKTKYYNSIVARFHNSDLYEEIKNNYIPFRSKLLNHLTSAVFISEKGKRYLKNRYPDVNFQSRVFKLGVEKIKTNKASEDECFRIVSCSYVVPIKRIDLIIDALNTLSVNVEWTHIGGGPLLDEIKKKSKSLKNNIKPLFLGHVKNKDVLEFYKTHCVDLFINVSLSEGIPVSIMEAIAAGIPVIATDVGGTSEIIDETFGKLIEKEFSVLLLGKLLQEFYSKSTEDKLKMRKAAVDFWEKNFNAKENYNEFALYLSGL